MTYCKAENVIHFANRSIDVNNLEDMVVLAIHTGRIYSIVEVVSSISAESPLEENADIASSDYTYVEYFKTMLVIIYLHDVFGFIIYSFLTITILINFLIT